MEYLNRFKSTVSSVAYSAAANINTALPGNPVTREYEAIAQIGSAGPGLTWKIYSGHKRSTKQKVAVWLFEKRDVDRWPKREREMFCELVKRGVSQLTRLRHPRLLIVEHPLEESRESFAFCTEPVFASLANALGRIDNMPDIIPPHLNDFHLLDVEIRHGLCQLSEALAFLHNDAKILHRNITPESVIVNERGQWKLAGFDFCAAGTLDANTVSYPMLEWEKDLLACVQPSLDYLAPEYILASRCDPASDMFSMGVLAYTLFNKGKPLLDNGNSINTFKKNTTTLKALPPKILQSLPNEFRDDVKMALNFTPDLRPDATQFSKIAYFDDPKVKTLNYFESLCQMDNGQKAQFFKELPPVLQQFPKRPLLQMVMPVLAGEFSTPDLIPFILPSVFQIAELAMPPEFAHSILPHLVPVFAMQRPYQIALMLLQKMELLLAKTPEEDVKRHVLPLLYNSLDSDTPKVQELCLGIIPTVGKLVNRDAMKNQMLPKLLQLACEAPVLSVKVNSLVCIGKLLNNLEKWMITDQILPALPKINSKEPGVLMAILGIYKLSFADAKRLNISKDLYAKSALPFLMAASVENSLNLGQFDQFITLIRSMLDKVETEQRQRLAQLSAMQEDQRTVSDFSEVLSQSQAKKAVSPELQGLDAIAATQNGVQPQIGAKKGPLTLEEKKRLAAEQEHNIRLRAQPQLNPQSETTSATAKRLPSTTLTPNVRPILPAPVTAVPAKPVDLTASLMASPLIPPPAPPSLSAMNNSFGGFVSSPSNGAFGQFTSAPPMPPMGPNGAHGAMAPMGLTPSQFGMESSPRPQPQPQKKANLSAFDDLNPFGATKPSMSQSGGFSANKTTLNSLKQNSSAGNLDAWMK